MKTVLVAIGVILTANAFALPAITKNRNAYEEVVLGTNGESAFETLEALYRSHNLPANKDAFSDTTWKCVGVRKSSPDVLWDISYGLKKRIISAAQPSRGPMFPGKPEVSENVLVYRPNVFTNEMLSYVENYVTPTDLVLKLKQNPFTYIASTSEDGSISFRRDQNNTIISVLFESKINTDDQYVFGAGYCYKE